MPENAHKRSSGWLALEVAIVLLIVLLLLSIHIPKRQWEDHVTRKDLCRHRLENIYFASHFYFQKNRTFNDDIASLLHFAEIGSLKVFPAGFKLDRLTRSDSGIDSFVVDYFDPYPMFSHFKDLPDTTFSADRDSVVLNITPLPKFSFLPATKYTFAAENIINVALDDRGDQGKFLLVGSQGQLRRQQILADVIEVIASNYIFNISREDIETCPSTESSFNTWVNVKIAIIGEMIGTLSDSIPETPLSSSSLLSGMVVYRWLKQADGLANATLVQEKAFEVVEDSMIIAWNNDFLDSIAVSLSSSGKEALAEAIYDSLLEDDESLEDNFVASWEEIREQSYSYMNSLKELPKFAKIRDNIVNDMKSEIASANLMGMLETVRTEGILSVSETGVINSSNDSITYYSDPKLIKDRLFVEHSDSVTNSYLSRDDISDLLSRFSFEEFYRVARIDSTGITISCPIDGAYTSPRRSFLEKFFSVEGEIDHGRVEDGDLSWSDKR